jgi:hypothetical protein
MKLDMSDFRTSLNLGHLRHATEKLDQFFTDGGRRSTSVFSCRGHHHDPVYDYTGMTGAYPMLVTFPYLAQPSREATLDSASTSLPLSIARILFGTSAMDKADSRVPPSRAGPVNEHLNLIVPMFWAFIVDPCMPFLFKTSFAVCSLRSLLELPSSRNLRTTLRRCFANRSLWMFSQTSSLQSRSPPIQSFLRKLRTLRPPTISSYRLPI